MSLQALRASREKKVAEMRQLVNTAEAENRDMNEEEAGKFDAMSADVTNLDAQIARLESLEGMEATLDEPADSRVAGVRGHPGRAAAAAPKEFESLGEFIHAVRFRQNDPRLADLYAEPQAADDMQLGEGASGGFMVPTQQRDELLQVSPSQAIVRPRANVIPAGSPPDAEITMPALDQSSDQNMYGGVEVRWIEEGGEKQKTDAKLRNIKLKPHEVAAHVVITDKLLRNWQASGTFISGLLRRAIIAAEDRAFLSGDGVGKPLGATKADACLAVNRTTASDVTYDDLLAMDEKLIVSAMNSVWVVSKRAKTRLRKMQDPEGHYIWQESAVPGEPATLLGYPVVVSDRVAALGAKGDVMLIDFSHYLIKDGSGIFVSASEHALFTQNKTIIKAFWNVDGQPWLNGPIKGEDGEQYSPFVALDVPSGSP